MTADTDQMITLEAPCDIDEGFAFDVIIEGRVFQIEVVSQFLINIHYIILDLAFTCGLYVIS